jgi:PAS domain S-box-containing protein
MHNGENQILAGKKQIFILLALLSLFIVFLGYYYYNNAIENVRLQKKNEIQAIADIKIEQLSEWYIDELLDANTISHNGFIHENIHRQLSSGNNESSLHNLLYELKAEHNYTDILLLNPAGEIIASTNENIKVPDPEMLNKAKESVKTDSVLSTDLYVSGAFKNETMLGFVSPVKSKNDTVVLVFMFDADRYFYPLLQGWPVPSQSSEILLVRKEKDHVIFLNSLRHIKNKPLEFRLPLSRRDLPAVQAVQGYTGMFDGKDYRNVEVYAFISNVPETPWYLVAKIDKSELFQNIYSQLASIIIITLLLIFSTGITLFFIYSNKQKSVYRELYNKEKELWHSQEKFKVTIDSLGDGVITTDTEGKIQYLNKMAELLTGWKAREAKGRKLSEVYSVKNELTGAKENNIVEKVLKLGIVKELANHTLLVSRTGEEIPVMDTGAPVYDSEGSIIGLVLTFQDETEKRHHLNEIAESERRFRSFLDNLIEGCQIIGFDGYYKYVNKAAEIHNHTTKKELIGKSVSEAWRNFENTEVYKVISQCLQDKQERVLETSFIRNDGQVKWYELKLYAVTEGIFILSYDITNRKIAETEQRKLSRAIIQSPVSVIISDHNGYIEYVNPKFTEVTGYIMDEVRGKHISILTSDSVPPETIKNIWDVLRSGNEWKGELERRKKDGTKYWEQLSVSPITNAGGETTNFIELAEDITERKKMLNDLIAAKEKAEEINKLKTHFFANMSHELRTPFVGIMGYAEILSDLLTSPEARAMAEGILDTSKRMKETLTKILNISRFEFNGIEPVFKKAEAASVIKGIFDQYSAAAANKNLRYILAIKFEQLNIITDTSLLSEVLNNLINNSIVYTNKGCIEVTADRQTINNKDTLVIKVADTGIGIPKEKYDLVWEEFRQVSEGFTRNYQGTGLGLSIAKKYTGLLKGKIYFESEVGQGTTFTLELPIEE